MSTYFDATKPADQNLIHSSVRSDSELANVASQVEYDVINHFREEQEYLGQNTAPANYDDELSTVIKLRGYTADADNAETHLKEALRRTIADVIEFRLLNYDNDHGVTSVKRGGRSESYEKAAPTKSDWPEGWGHRLARFSSEEIVYGL